MPYDTVTMKIQERVATLTVNRPEKRNALNGAVRAELVDALDHLRDEDEVRVVVLTGAGDKAFVAGADIGEFDARTPLQQREAMSGRRVFDELAAFPKPTIAAVNGYALGGGCELAMACDVRVAARSAKLGQPEVKLGILPGAGGTQRLPRLVGTGTALRLLLTGELVDADEAQRMGLVDIVVDDADFTDRVRSLARAMAVHSPVAMRLIKDAVRAAAEMPLAQGLAYERELFITAFSSEDRTEGVRAFLEKRPAEFHGR